MQQRLGINNLIRGTTFFQHAGVSIVYVFMPILAQNLTTSIFEVGLTIASFFLAQILSSLYFGRVSDASGKRLIFIKAGFVGCALMFGLHYMADNSFFLLLARLGAGLTSGMMIPAMLAYTYESGKDKSKVASVISFHALGWLAGIVAAGIANNEKTIFLVSAGLFLIGLAMSTRLPNYVTPREIESGTTKKSNCKKQASVFVAFAQAHRRNGRMDNPATGIDRGTWRQAVRSVHGVCGKHSIRVHLDEFDGHKNHHQKHHEFQNRNWAHGVCVYWNGLYDKLVDGNSVHGSGRSHLGIFVHRRQHPPDGKQSKIHIDWDFQFHHINSKCDWSGDCRNNCALLWSHICDVFCSRHLHCCVSRISEDTQVVNF